MSKEKTLQKLTQEIKEICTKYNLNLAVFDGKIGFIDQTENKIIPLLEPQLTATLK